MKRVIELINPVDTPDGVIPAGQEVEFTRLMGKIYARCPNSENFFLVTTDNIKRLHISETTAKRVLEYLKSTQNKIKR